MKFYLGTHKPAWLGRYNVPLFVSDRWLRNRRTLPRAVAGWALDSGGFTELSTYGTWDNGPTPAEYATHIRRYRDEIGHLDWASPQDWMCEAKIIAKTGLSVGIHQQLTTLNYLELKRIAADLPIIAVLQGDTLDDYLRHIDLYAMSGVNLTEHGRVGIGSVCRRQHTAEIARIVATIADLGIRLHGFGVKTQGFARYARHLTSADSMAWSFAARYEPAMAGHTHSACQNCPIYALIWRKKILAGLAASAPKRPAQLALWETQGDK